MQGDPGDPDDAVPEELTTLASKMIAQVPRNSSFKGHRAVLSDKKFREAFPFIDDHPFLCVCIRID
jgi:hypothetical protein